MGLETERRGDGGMDVWIAARSVPALDGTSYTGGGRPGRRLFLSDYRLLSGGMAYVWAFDGSCVCEQSGRRYLDAYDAAGQKGKWFMGRNTEKETAVFALCDPCVDLDDACGSWMKQEVSASYTVEASFVMAIALFFIAALLNGVFEVHGRITGRFVLQEAMERCLYREEGSLRGQGMTVEEVSGRAGQYLRGFFRCGDATLMIREDGRDLEGVVKSSTETGIFLRGQDPERAIRLLTAVANGMEMIEKAENAAE